jgi:hypothetical protein
MAWPSNVSAGQLITASHINAIKDALAAWGGDVNGGGYDLTNVALLQLIGDTGKPAAGASYRGYVWITRGGAGVADLVEICVKNSGDTYQWVALF